jgi:hypothetical protein
VALVRTDVSEEHIASIIRVESISMLGTMLAMKRAVSLLVAANVVPSSPILVTLKMEAIQSYKTSVLIRATECHITEDGILPQHCAVVTVTGKYSRVHYK